MSKPRGDSARTPASNTGDGSNSYKHAALLIDAKEAAAMVEQNPTLKKPTEPALLCLALRPKEAAKALGIGERLLWSKTNAGEIPYVRIGRAVVYPVDMLRDWLAEKARKAAGT